MKQIRKFNLGTERLWQDPAPCLWKVEPSDFQVSELWSPPQAADGKVDAGEHTLLLVEKVGQNTQWVARQIARHAAVRDMDIGFHGLKDRHAITTQWFSIYSGGRKIPDWSLLNLPGVSILKVGRTPRKLRRGGHQGNRFVITLKAIQGDRQAIQGKLETIRTSGFPNYFGQQRFGISGNNLYRAEEWLTNGTKPSGNSARGLVLSAARSYLFNKILERRVLAGTWADYIAGDQQAPVDQRSDDMTRSATGPLLGGHEFLAELAGDVEKAATEGFATWLDALHRQGVRTSRRSFVAIPYNFVATIEDDVIRLAFDLAPGSFASVLLDQVFELRTPALISQH